MKLAEDEERDQERVPLLSSENAELICEEDDEVGVDSFKSILVVLGSFLNHVTSFGFAYSVGVLVVPFTKEFDKERGTVSWFASILSSGKKKKIKKKKKKI